MRTKSLEINNQNRWHTRGQAVINDGDEARLYCHSYRTGSFRGLTNTDDLQPPYWAPGVYRKTGDDKLRVQSFDFSDIETNFLASKWFAGLDWKPTFNNSDSSNIQNSMNNYDEGTSTTDQHKDLKISNDFFGYSDPVNMKPVGVGPSMVDPAPDIQKYISVRLQNWKNSTQFNQEILFRVRYVYE